MPEVSSLILNVESKSVKKATDSLDDFSMSAKRAERSSSGLTNSVNDNSFATDRMTRQSNLASKKVSGLSSVMTKANVAILAVAAAATVATASFVGLKKSISIAAEFQQTSLALETLIGDVGRANVLMKELVDFSVRTPFDPDQIIGVSKQLVAFGIETNKVSGLIENLGELASGSGASMDQLGRIMGKVYTKGRAQAEELNMFAEAGIPIIQQLAESYQITEAQVLKLGSQGKISFNDIEQAVISLTTGTGKFAGLMEKQSKTLNGRLSTLKGTISETGKTIGGPFLSFLSQSAEAMSDFTFETNETIKGLQILLGLRDEMDRGVGDATVITRKESPGASTKQAVDGISQLEAALLDLRLEGQEVESLMKRLDIPLAEATVILNQSKKEQKAIVFELVKEKAARDAINRASERAERAESRKRSMAEEAVERISQQVEIQELLNEGKRDEAATQRVINRLERRGFSASDIEDAVEAQQRLNDARREGAEIRASERSDRRSIAAAEDVAESLASRRQMQSDHFDELRRMASQQAQDNEAIIQDARQSDLDNEQYYHNLSRQNWEQYAEDIKTINQDKADFEEKLQQQSFDRTLSATGRLFGALSQLEKGESERSQKRKQALAITAATIDTYSGATKAYNDPTILSTYGKIAAAGAVVVSGLANVQQIREAGNYATGGIVPGSSFTGDRLQANVNSGEMILNMSQQQRMFNELNGNSSTSGIGSTQLNVTVENYGSSEITVERMSETDVRIIAREVVREEAPSTIAADLSNPNSRTSNAIARNTNSQRRRS